MGGAWARTWVWGGTGWGLTKACDATGVFSSSAPPLLCAPGVWLLVCATGVVDELGECGLRGVRDRGVRGA